MWLQPHFFHPSLTTATKIQRYPPTFPRYSLSRTKVLSCCRQTRCLLRTGLPRPTRLSLLSLSLTFPFLIYLQILVNCVSFVTLRISLLCYRTSLNICRGAKSTCLGVCFIQSFFYLTFRHFSACDGKKIILQELSRTFSSKILGDYDISEDEGVLLKILLRRRNQFFKLWWLSENLDLHPLSLAKKLP